MVFQRRGDFGEPRENFYRSWADYKRGFGDKEKEFWLGNDQIHELTKAGDKKLRVELGARDGRILWAEYDNFPVESEAQGYLLRVAGYSGNVDGHGDCLQNDSKFSTLDRDNDKRGIHCANYYHAAWWFSG